MSKFLKIKSSPNEYVVSPDEILSISEDVVSGGIKILTKTSSATIASSTIEGFVKESKDKIKDLNAGSQSVFLDVNLEAGGIDVEEISGGLEHVGFFENINANGGSIEDATLLSYGVNIVEVADKDNYSLKLPQPINGRKVSVVNKSNYPIYIYPSNIGGVINNLNQSQPFIIDSYNNIFDFVCIKNPNPGAWVVATPAISQIDLGELYVASIDTSQNTIINFVSPSDFDLSNSFNINSILSNNGVNNSPINSYQIGGVNFHGRKPSFQVNQITKIKVYTNFSANDGGQSISMSGRISAAGSFNQYDPSNPSSPAQSYGQSAINLPFGFNKTSDFLLDKVVGGVSTALPPNTTSSSVGDIGTLYGEFEYDFGAFDPSNPQHIQFGDFFVGQLSSGGSSSGSLDTFWTNYFQINIFLQNTQQVINDLKIRVFLEYR